jgi:PBP1b-binding outer membrane lipoprotein LpoB
MQFFRAFAVISLAWTASLFLQGCSSDSDDLVTSNDDNTTATVTSTATATVTSTATTTVTTTVA